MIPFAILASLHSWPATRPPDFKSLILSYIIPAFTLYTLLQCTYTTCHDTYMYAHLFRFWTFTHTHRCIYVYIYMYIYISKCIYIYIYMYMNMHVCTYAWHIHWVASAMTSCPEPYQGAVACWVQIPFHGSRVRTPAPHRSRKVSTVMGGPPITGPWGQTMWFDQYDYLDFNDMELQGILHDYVDSVWQGILHD